MVMDFLSFLDQSLVLVGSAGFLNPGEMNSSSYRRDSNSFNFCFQMKKFSLAGSSIFENYFSIQSVILYCGFTAKKRNETKYRQWMEDYGCIDG